MTCLWIWRSENSRAKCHKYIVTGSCNCCWVAASRRYCCQLRLQNSFLQVCQILKLHITWEIYQLELHFRTWHFRIHSCHFLPLAFNTQSWLFTCGHFAEIFRMLVMQTIVSSLSSVFPKTKLGSITNAFLCNLDELKNYSEIMKTMNF